MNTNYAGHEGVYRRLQAAGQVGWDATEKSYSVRQNQLAEILRQGHAPATGRLLELGCGAGNISVWLAGRGFTVCGVDISETAIRWAQARAREHGVQAEFVIGDVLQLDQFADNTYDFVLDGKCLHCIIGPDRRRFLATAFRLLRPGGYFLVDTMCGPVAAGRFEGYDPASRCSVVQGIATRYFGTPEEIRREVTEAGFRILETALEKEAAVADKGARLRGGVLDRGFAGEASHWNMIIQARKDGPTIRVAASRRR